MNEQECRSLVRERSGGMCEARVKDVCRGPGESMHHRWKRSHGGEWCPSNILHVCGHGTVGCHGYIEANPASSMKKGLWLRGVGVGMRAVQPDQVPVSMVFRGMPGVYLLEQNGSLTWLSSKALAQLGV